MSVYLQHCEPNSGSNNLEKNINYIFGGLGVRFMVRFSVSVNSFCQFGTISRYSVLTVRHCNHNLIKN